MEKANKEMLEKLRNVKSMEEDKLERIGKLDEIKVDDVKHYGQVELNYEENGKKVTKKVDVYAVIEGKTIKYYSDEMLLAVETMGVGKRNEAIIPSLDYERMFEQDNSIRDIIQNLKQKEIEEQEKPKDKRSIKSLNELEKEEEKEKEEKEDNEKIKKQSQMEQEEKRKPTQVIEVIKPDKAKVDYWKTLKQELGLPEQVDTLAFAYPNKPEDRIETADITVYMLDKEGNIINDLDINDYLEFDASTGNNPIKDDTVRLEEDENKGKAQIADNNTMIRLKSKNSANSYISLEQKNEMGDHHDINAGRKIVGGTQNVEKQLETNKFKVWDSEREKLINDRAGIYNINRIHDEASVHKEHGEEEISIENADGDELTKDVCESPYVPDTEITWEQFSKSLGDRDVKDVVKEFYERYDGENSHELIMCMQNEHNEKEERTEESKENEEYEEYEGRVPWDSARNRR